jgi:hypothetical protein
MIFRGCANERPVAECLEVLEHHVEPFCEVIEHVVVVDRLSVAGVERRGGASHQHGSRHDLLQRAALASAPSSDGGIRGCYLIR